MIKIMITGPQGSGKTTQAEKLAGNLGICFIGAGELLRNLADQKTKIGIQVKEDLKEGELVDDQIIADLIKKRISEAECQNGFVTDGYPRSMSQHQLYDPGFDIVFYLKVSDGEAVKRLVERGREDDTPEAIKERLSWYHQETQPLLDYYQSLNKLVIIDGEKSVEMVASDIASNLKTGF